MREMEMGHLRCRFDEEKRARYHDFGIPPCSNEHAAAEDMNAW